MKPQVYNYFHCLSNLLTSLGWQGKQRSVLEVTPHLQREINLEDLREMMSRLGYYSHIVKINIKKIPDHPGLFHIKDKVYLVHGTENNCVFMKDLETNEDIKWSKTKKLKGMFCYFHTDPEKYQLGGTWLTHILTRFKNEYLQLLATGLLNSIFALTLPFFIRAVFDWALPSKSEDTLFFLVIGLIAAMISHHVIHSLQNRSFAYFGARLNMILSTGIVEKLLKLPLSLVEDGNLSEKMSRIKQIDSIRDFFTSPLAQLCLEGPFFIFFLVILAIMGGVLALIPIILIIIFSILGFILFPLLRMSTCHLSNAYQERFSFLIETFQKLSTIKFLGGVKSWEKQFESKNHYYVTTSTRNEVINAFASNISNSLIKIAGIVTIIWGSYRVINDEMSIGTLIAIVLLIWRALSPIQSAFLYLSNIDMTVNSVNQLNHIMSLPEEKYALPYLKMPRFKGHIFCDSLYFHYTKQNFFCLQNITCEINPGNLIGIIGENGSGKTTLLKLLLNFYDLSSGNLYYDGIDIHNIAPNILRKCIGYIPQQAQFFHGTILQNLLLSAPDATIKDVYQACDDADILKDIEKLPHQFDTRMNTAFMSSINAGFQQKLNLARSYLKDSLIMFFDEPGSNLDHLSDTVFSQKIQAWRGQKTCIIVTHRPSLAEKCDKLLVLREGKMVSFEPPKDVYQQMVYTEKRTA